MRRSTIVIYPQRRWLPRGPVLVAAILTGLAIAGFWPEPERVAPVAAEAVPARPAPVRETAPLARVPAEPLPPPAQEAPRRVAAPSTMVAPGVHVTPIGVPPGIEPAPAGPGPEDTEPEN